VDIQVSEDRAASVFNVQVTTFQNTGYHSPVRPTSCNSATQKARPDCRELFSAGLVTCLDLPGWCSNNHVIGRFSA
jgi:hypothetical protein